MSGVIEIDGALIAGRYLISMELHILREVDHILMIDCQSDVITLKRRIQMASFAAGSVKCPGLQFPIVWLPACEVVELSIGYSITLRKYVAFNGSKMDVAR